MTENNNTTPLPALTSHLTNESSNTDFTDVTGGTSIKTDLSIHHGASSINISNDEHGGLQSRRLEVDIRQQYELASKTVPNVTEEMEKWFEKADRYGFLEEDVTEVNASQVEKEVERSEKWANMATQTILQGETVHMFRPSEKFVKRVFKGIPDGWRRDAWYYMCTDGLRKAQDDAELCKKYKELLTHRTLHERQIDLDIPRTMHGHIMFRQRYGLGQRALFNVLRAFACYDEEVGYCQGMTSIVAVLLMYCEEEKAFLMFVHMFLRDGLHNLFIPGFPALLESFYIQEQLIRRYLPKLHRHMHSIGLNSDVYATRWYITLFTGGVVRYHTLLRIWDTYFLAGFDIFYYVALALLKTFQNKLLHSDLETCMQLLGSTLAVPDDDKFMKSVKKLYDRGNRHGIIDELKAAYRRRNGS